VRESKSTRNSPSRPLIYRKPSISSTASSVDENSDSDWTHPANRYTYTRHHPYQSHHPSRKEATTHTGSPSYSRRASTHSAYSQSHDDMTAFVRKTTSGNASANASADEGSNSTSHYDGDSPVASYATSSPLSTFAPNGQLSVQPTHTVHDGSLYAGQPAGAAGSNTGGRGSQQRTAPLSLDSLPSYPPDQKPPFSYPVLIRLAILGSPEKRLLLSQIYQAIEEKFPWYRDSAPKAWKVNLEFPLYNPPGTALRCRIRLVDCTLTPDSK